MPYKDPEKNRISRRDSTRKTTRERRISALMFLGGRCEHCGFNDARALQFDHINGDGAKHRREMIGHSSWQSSTAVLKHPEMFQVLCANCNWIKRYDKQEHAKRED